MKLFVSLFVVSFCLNAFSAPLEAVDCKKEMIAEALSKSVKSASLSALLVSSFEVTDFDYKNSETDEYVVTIERKNRSNGKIQVMKYSAAVKDMDKCIITVR